MKYFYLLYKGYLPSDATGDYIYRIFELLSLLFCILTTISIKNTKTELFKWYYLVPVMFILAILVHPGLNANPFHDVAWTFAIYMESLAIFP